MESTTQERVYAASIWAQKVKEKTNFLCLECGSDEDVQAVHLTTPSLGGRNTLDNGVALCLPCRTKQVIPSTKVRVNFSIPSSLNEKLESYCQDTGRSTSDVMKQLIADCAFSTEWQPNGYYVDAQRDDIRKSISVLTMVYKEFSKKCSGSGRAQGEAIKSLIYNHLIHFGGVK
jgi:hypothetical protein